MGGGIQTFTSVVTDKTFADIETSPTAHVENLPLLLRIPPNGGSQRINLVVPIEQLLNPESLQIRVGYKLKKLDAAGAAQDIVLTDAILSPGGAYCIRKVDVIINNKMQFGSSVNRDYGPERRRMEILRRTRFNIALQTYTRNVRRREACCKYGCHIISFFGKHDSDCF